ncbi:MAG TPA: hypothetical protein VFV66_33560 [Nonomuraea sp.]|nr:hypothetical protein [Nonomuraea sp.]
MRFGEPVHVFNNYYRNNSLYGIASTQNAGVLVEGNYVENVAAPCPGETTSGLPGVPRHHRKPASRPAGVVS